MIGFLVAQNLLLLGRQARGAPLQQAVNAGAGQGQQGTRLMEIGLGISFLAAALQTDHDLQLNLIWLFDHNGIFHLGHTAGIITFASGLYRSQKSPENISAKLQA